MNDHQEHITTASSADPSRSEIRRMRLLKLGLLVLFGVISLRLVQIQIIESEKYREIARRQYEAKVDLPAMRGSLFDRKGTPIATNTVLVSFAADPERAGEDALAIVEKFSQVFGKPKKHYLAKLREKKRFVWLERHADINTLKKFDLKKLGGIVVRYEQKRLYHDQVAGQLIGCTDIDNRGLAGIEHAYNEDLRGIEGYVIFQRDGRGRAKPSVDYPRVDPTNGSDITLTIDMKIQAIAEKELRRGVEQSNAESGIVVMLRPQTGEVLALAQFPGVDPNAFGKHNPRDQKLRAITDLFEPGSVFKIVTASAAIDYGLVDPEGKFFAENGSYVTYVRNRARKITDVHAMGWTTFQEAMEQSSNIVMAKVSDLIGSERLYRMCRDYGFGIPTNIELPGEVRGVLKKPVDWSGTTLNTIAFGYEVGATPLQIAMAYAAIANGGVLMKPYIFMKETDASGALVRIGEPQPIRRVVTESTARTLTAFFEGTVERGTGKPARIPGVRVAGKTGTAKKLVEGRYEKNYTASFVGFYPVESPQVVCLVMIDNPRGSSYTGGATSAPVFRAIAERILSTSDLFAPSPTRPEFMTISTDLPNEPKRSMTERNPRPESDDEQDAIVFRGDVVPDVRGYSLRRALSLLSMANFEPVVTGNGTVISQYPTAGHSATPGMRVHITCQPRANVDATAN